MSVNEIDNGGEAINQETLNSKIVNEFCETFETVNLTNNTKDSTKINKPLDNSIEKINAKFPSLNEVIFNN